MDLLTATLYPLTLLAGSLFSSLSPSDASSTSYFSQKHNIFNVLFVKRGWLWTTCAFLLHAWYLRRSSKPRAIFRYGLATLWWVFVTQWFFGPPIMDRTFLFTGGTCAAVATHAEHTVGILAAVATSTACKVAGGVWSGGHDLSGHTFLLTHASMFLWSEVAPTVVTGGRGWHRGTWGVLVVLSVWWWMLLMTGVYFHTWREKVGFSSYPLWWW